MHRKHEWAVLFLLVWFATGTEGKSSVLLHYELEGFLTAAGNGSTPYTESFSPPDFVASTVIKMKLEIIGRVDNATAPEITGGPVNALLMDGDWNMILNNEAFEGGGANYSNACPREQGSNADGDADDNEYHVVMCGAPDLLYRLEVEFILAELLVSDHVADSCDVEWYCKNEIDICKNFKSCEEALDGDCNVVANQNIDFLNSIKDNVGDCFPANTSKQSRDFLGAVAQCAHRCVNNQGVYIADLAASDRHIYISYFDVSEDDVANFPLHISITSNNTKTPRGYMLVANLLNGCPTMSDFYRSADTFSRLSYTTQATLQFGLASIPAISPGRWYLALFLNSSEPQEHKVSILRGFYADNGIHFVGSIGIPFIVAFLSLLLTIAVHRDTESGLSVWVKLKGVFSQWFVGMTPIPHSFSWWTFLLVCVFGIATFQVVLSEYLTMLETGNNDICYYNDRCFHPARTYHVPINNLESNSGYIIMGTSFVAQIAIYQISYFRKVDQIQYGYTTFYALGIALAAEGWYSLMYHICPTIGNFQFDTMNMFLIAALLKISVYQQGEREKNFHFNDGDDYNFHYIRAPKFYVFFVIPLLTFNYIGVEVDSYSTTFYNRNGLAAAVFVWQLLIFAYLWFRTKNNTKLQYSGRDYTVNTLHKKITVRCGNRRACSLSGWNCYFVLIVFILIYTAYVITTAAMQVASLFLMLMVGLTLVYLVIGGFLHVIPTKNFYFLIGSMMSAAIILFAIATYYFTSGSTNKAIEAELSRELNGPCVAGIGWHYFDMHDLWHIFSSYGLFLFMQAVFWVNPPDEHQIVPKLLAAIKQRLTSPSHERKISSQEKMLTSISPRDHREQRRHQKIRDTIKERDLKKHQKGTKSFKLKGIQITL